MPAGFSGVWVRLSLAASSTEPYWAWTHRWSERAAGSSPASPRRKFRY